MMFLPLSANNEKIHHCQIENIVWMEEMKLVYWYDMYFFVPYIHMYWNVVVGGSIPIRIFVFYYHILYVLVFRIINLI